MMFGAVFLFIFNLANLSSCEWMKPKYLNVYFNNLRGIDCLLEQVTIKLLFDIFKLATRARKYKY